MAKKGRSSKNFAAIKVEGTLALSTLVNGVVLASDIFGANLTEDFFVMSADIMAEITGLTAGEGNPHRCGFAHGDYSVTEIKEALDVELLGPGNKIEQERSRRLVRYAGVMYNDISSQVKLELIGRNGSRLVRTKLKFTIQDGKTMNVWVQNKSGGTLTTGATLRYSGTVYGRWLV